MVSSTAPPVTPATVSASQSPMRARAGAKFQFKLTLKQYDGDDDALLHTLLTGLKLLEWDSLGGSGSRGYGKVRFDELELDKKDISDRFKDLNPFA